MKLRKKSVYAGLLMLLMTIVVSLGVPAPVHAYPDVIIDDFTDTTTLTQSGVGTATSTFDDVGILGGERDLVLNVTSGGGNLVVDTNTSFANQFSHSAGTGVIGTTTLVYDGDDDDPTTLNPTGLGSIDMTINNNNAFMLLIERDDLQGEITILAYTDANSCSELPLVLPGGIGAAILPRAFLFFFNDFTLGSGCTNPADFTDIGALQVFIDPDINDSLDLVFRVFAAVSIDFGDVDDTFGFYMTQLADQGDGNILGAGHVLSNLWLGASVDSEDDGQPNGNNDALGDDQDGNDDEDGVIRPPGVAWVTGSATGGQVEVTVNGDGCLYGWIDWNRNGLFANAASTTSSTTNDRIIAQSVSSGTFIVQFPVPSAFNFSGGPINARFRLYPRDPGGSCWTAGPTYAKFPDRFQHYGGEVEDYTWNFTPTAVSMQNISTATTNPANWVGALALVLAVVTTGAVVARRRQPIA